MNIIETRNLTKMFDRFCANDSINIAVKQGEVRAIIGENGAGKTTLMNMLYGMVKPTSGDILIKGEKVTLSSPKDAIEHGLGMVHQHFKLVPSLTVYENVFLGVEATHWGLINTKAEREAVVKLIEKYNLDLNPDDKIEDISVGAKQRVEILKMLYRDVDMLILDEPTSVLTPQEVDALIETLIGLKEQGKTILIITHKLQEVKRLADTITVIRRGKIIDTIDAAGASMEELAKMMVGRPVIMQVDKGEKPTMTDEVVWSAEHLTVMGVHGKEAVKGISLQVRKGEVLGIAGVEGNGQTEFVKAITGMMVSSAGTVSIHGSNITNMWPDELRNRGIGILPEDRYAEGLCLEMPVSQNLIAGYHGRSPFYKKPFFDKKAIRRNKEELVERFDIRLSAEDPNVSGLSGGNAQKIIVAREFSQNPDFLICCQPTRGVDVGSIEFIHSQIIKLRNEGKAILLVSSELSEIMALSDSIAVMYKGEITGFFDGRNVTAEELGFHMTGIKRQSGAEMGA